MIVHGAHAGSFVEERDASIYGATLVAMRPSMQEIVLARRQAAEAQNHIFDRFVALLLFTLMV